MPTKPTELVLTARVARRYYLDRRSKTEIADELGISRFRVARLLEAALNTGMVRIEIGAHGTVHTDLSAQLQDVFGLSHAIVLDVADEDETAMRAHLARATADVLRELVTPEDVLGLAWARSLTAIGDSLAGFAPCQVVQLTGAVSRPDGSDVLEMVRKVARAGGGAAHVFYAPMVAPDAATARAMQRQPELARALGLIPQVTVAAVGIGAWAPGLSTIYDAVEPAARQSAKRQGVVAEISGVFVDNDGQPLTIPLTKRIIGITGEQLGAIRTVVATAYGDGKVAAVRSALAGGLVSDLITHTSLARKLLHDGPL